MSHLITGADRREVDHLRYIFGNVEQINVSRGRYEHLLAIEREVIQLRADITDPLKERLGQKFKDAIPNTLLECGCLESLFKLLGEDY